MYKLSKEFSFAMGHRLSCHSGACRNFHGHNYKVEIGIKGEYLNPDGMLIDFADLKAVAGGFLDMFDHALMVNETDEELVTKMKKVLGGLKVIVVPFEPTAENMAKEIYKHVGDALTKMYKLDMDYVTVYETDTSKATYCEE